MDDDDTAVPAHNKNEDIQQACETRSVERLREYARSEGGLLDDELRRRACKPHVHPLLPASFLHTYIGPILLACDTSDDDSAVASKELPEHRDEGQVQLDVDRSFVYYPEGWSTHTPTNELYPF